jgi:hypothetical protein
LNNAPAWYPRIVRVPQAWGLGYHLSDGHTRARLFTSTTWPYVRRSASQLIENHPSDLIVSVHPLANAPVLHALKMYFPRPAFITVVTDLVSGHALWYHRRTDLCMVPTESSRQRALECGLRRDRQGSRAAGRQPILPASRRPPPSARTCWLGFPLWF